MKNICERLLLKPVKFHQDCPFLMICTSGSNWCISFSFCIITCSFACQFSLHYYWYCYNQKQSSGSVLLKRCSYKFRKIDTKTKDCTKDSFLMAYCARGNLPPTLILILTVNQTLTLTGAVSLGGQLSGHHF